MKEYTTYIIFMLISLKKSKFLEAKERFNFIDMVVLHSKYLSNKWID